MELMTQTFNNYADKEEQSQAAHPRYLRVSRIN